MDLGNGGPGVPAVAFNNHVSTMLLGMGSLDFRLSLKQGGWLPKEQVTRGGLLSTRRPWNAECCAPNQAALQAMLALDVILHPWLQQLAICVMCSFEHGPWQIGPSSIFSLA
eukprot:1156063-Pelagomonas_calceolata.AAC.6